MLTRFINRIPTWVWIIAIVLNLVLMIFNKVNGSMGHALLNFGSCLLCWAGWHISKRIKEGDK